MIIFAIHDWYGQKGTLQKSKIVVGSNVPVKFCTLAFPHAKLQEYRMEGTSAWRNNVVLMETTYPPVDLPCEGKTIAASAYKAISKIREH